MIIGKIVKELLINTAKLRYRAYIVEINIGVSRNIDKNTIVRLTTCNFIKQNLLITEITSVGKISSHQLSAIKLTLMVRKSCILISTNFFKRD